MSAQRVGTNLTQVTSPADEEDDPNRLPTFVKAEPNSRKMPFPTMFLRFSWGSLVAAGSVFFNRSAVFQQNMILALHAGQGPKRGHLAFAAHRRGRSSSLLVDRFPLPCVHKFKVATFSQKDGGKTG